MARYVNCWHGWRAQRKALHASHCVRAVIERNDMGSGDVILHLRINVADTQAEIEVVSQTPRTVLVKIDPTTPWDSDGLLHLSTALQIVAKTMPFGEPEK